MQQWSVRLTNGSYECTLCGVIFEVPAELTAQYEAAELADPPYAIVVAGVELHRCEFPTESGSAMLSLVLSVPVSGFLLALAGSV